MLISNKVILWKLLNKTVLNDSTGDKYNLLCLLAMTALKNAGVRVNNLGDRGQKGGPL